MKTSTQRRANVRFTKEQFERLQKDQQLTGKSIPWLLKTAYFKKTIAAPTLDLETRIAVRRELSAIGNNLNQLTRMGHLELTVGLNQDLLDCLQSIRILKSFLGLDYGHR